jgi:hypothetical protein
MADDKPTIHIDDDWKRQAQEEKRRLAEEEQRRKAAAAAPVGAVAGPQLPGMPPAAERGPGAPPAVDEPRSADFQSIVQTLYTQALVYMGGVAMRGGEGIFNLDMARYYIDLLGVLEQKTAGNLTDEEKQMLDAVLYQARMTFINLATREAELP